MEIKNIITIDFDIIMAPSIELYNHIVCAQISVNSIANCNSLMKYCNADLEIYKIISFYLFKLFEDLKEENIHFIFDHHQIWNYLEENTIYNVYNIDHHHDYGYPDANPELYCGNWVLKMEESNKLNKYIWITDYSSDLFPNEKYERILLSDIDLNDLPKPDELIICASFQWIPEQFFPLFDFWLIFYNLYFAEKPKEIEKNNLYINPDIK